jgi:hypothetical protein
MTIVLNQHTVTIKFKCYARLYRKISEKLGADVRVTTMNDVVKFHHSTIVMFSRNLRPLLTRDPNVSL